VIKALIIDFVLSTKEIKCHVIKALAIDFMCVPKYDASFPLLWVYVHHHVLLFLVRIKKQTWKKKCTSPQGM